MKKLYVDAGYENNKTKVKVNLLLIHFTDENGIHIIYSPHLELSGSGNTEDEAKKSFDISLEDFIDYTVNKKTIGKVLTKLGWKIRGSHKKPKKMITPTNDDIFSRDSVKEILEKYEHTTSHETVNMPFSA